MKTFIATLCLMAALAAPALADSTVVLNSGERVTGQVIESGDRVGVATDEGMRMFDRSEIERIEHDAFGRATPRQLAAYRAAERAVDAAESPAEALATWRKYRDDCSQDDPLAAEADKQIARWAEALKQGKVLWAGKAVTRAERDRAKHEALEHVGRAATALRSGDTRQALSAARSALRLWPDHAGAQFIAALALHRDRQPGEAARRYRKVLDLHPHHVPTLNNLSVLEMTRGQLRSGVPLVMRALELAPDVAAINNNGYRVLLELERRDMQGFGGRIAWLRDAALRFESAMQRQGLRRWGTRWIEQERYEEYQQKNQAIDAQLAALIKELEDVEKELTVLLARVAELEELRRRAPSEWDVANGVDTDGDGNPDLFYPRDALTKERIDLELAQNKARIAVLETDRVRKVTAARKLKSQRIEPPTDGAYVLLEDPGAELLGDVSPAPAREPLVPSYVGPTSAAELLDALRSGRAVVLAEDGTFLGKATPDATDPQSMLNGQGLWGATDGQFSLLNDDTPHTRPDSERSVHNPDAPRPPRLFYDGNLLAYVTENTRLKPRLRLADLLAILRGE